MKKLTAFFQRLKIRQIISIVIVGAVLVLTTACNNGDTLGARPNNPPVQMGGNNNPHSMGGDGYTEYKASTDAKAVRQRSGQQHSSLSNGTLIAQSLPSGVGTNEEGLQYRGAEQPNEQAYRVRGANDATDLSSEKQGSIDRSDPKSKILERIGTQFEEATEFIKEDLDSSTEKAIANEKAKTDGSFGNDTIMRKSH